MAGTEGEIVLCFECGAKNRLKEGWTGAPVCGKCGEPLPVNPRPVAKAPAQAPRSAAGEKRPSWLPVYAITFALLVTLGIVYAVQQKAKPVVDYSDIVEQEIRAAKTSGSSTDAQAAQEIAPGQRLDTTGLTEVPPLVQRKLRQRVKPSIPGTRSRSSRAWMPGSRFDVRVAGSWSPRS